MPDPNLGPFAIPRPAGGLPLPVAIPDLLRVGPFVVVPPAPPPPPAPLPAAQPAPAAIPAPGVPVPGAPVAAPAPVAAVLAGAAPPHSEALFFIDLTLPAGARYESEIIDVGKGTTIRAKFVVMSAAGTINLIVGLEGGNGDGNWTELTTDVFSAVGNALLTVLTGFANSKVRMKILNAGSTTIVSEGICEVSGGPPPATGGGGPIVSGGVTRPEVTLGAPIPPPEDVVAKLAAQSAIATEHLRQIASGRIGVIAGGAVAKLGARGLPPPPPPQKAAMGPDGLPIPGQGLWIPVPFGAPVWVALVPGSRPIPPKGHRPHDSPTAPKPTEELAPVWQMQPSTDPNDPPGTEVGNHRDKGGVTGGWKRTKIPGKTPRDASVGFAWRDTTPNWNVGGILVVYWITVPGCTDIVWINYATGTLEIEYVGATGAQVTALGTRKWDLDPPGFTTYGIQGGSVIPGQLMQDSPGTGGDLPDSANAAQIASVVSAILLNSFHLFPPLATRVGNSTILRYHLHQEFMSYAVCLAPVFRVLGHMEVVEDVRGDLTSQDPAKVRSVDKFAPRWYTA